VLALRAILLNVFFGQSNGQNHYRSGGLIDRGRFGQSEEGWSGRENTSSKISQLAPVDRR